MKREPKRGTMRFQDKAVEVVNVLPGTEHGGVNDGRTGWYADHALIPDAHGFYPADIFTFEESKGQTPEEGRS
jgi:hypothetical protein